MGEPPSSWMSSIELPRRFMCGRFTHLFCHPIVVIRLPVLAMKMVYDREAAETALIRFNNNPTGFKKSRGASPLGSLSDALVMLRSGFDIIDTPYLQVRRQR